MTIQTLLDVCDRLEQRTRNSGQPDRDLMDVCRVCRGLAYQLDAPHLFDAKPYRSRLLEMIGAALGEVDRDDQPNQA